MVISLALGVVLLLRLVGRELDALVYVTHRQNTPA
jgi:hypothetical protein